MNAVKWTEELAVCKMMTRSYGDREYTKQEVYGFVRYVILADAVECFV
jgi:hypothetical protein